MPAIIPAEFRWNAGNNSGRIPAGIPVEYQRNAGNNSGGIPAGISVECRRNSGNNSGGIPAGIPVEYQRDAGNNSGGIPAGIPVEYWRNAGNNSGGIPAGIPFEYWRNAGNNPAEFRLEMSGIPGEYRRNAGNNSGGFQRNSGGIRPASTWNSAKVGTGIPAGFHRNSGSVFTREGQKLQTQNHLVELLGFGLSLNLSGPLTFHCLLSPLKTLLFRPCLMSQTSVVQKSLRLASHVQEACTKKAINSKLKELENNHHIPENCVFQTIWNSGMIWHIQPE